MLYRYTFLVDIIRISTISESSNHTKVDLNILDLLFKKINCGR